METRKKCDNCGDPIPEGKRSDSKFCCDTCKAQYHEKHKKDKTKSNLGGLNINQTDANIKNQKPFKEKEEPLIFRNLLSNLGNSDKETTEPETKTEGPPLPSQYLTKIKESPNLAYQLCKNELEKCRQDLSRCKADMDKINKAIEAEKQRNGSGVYVLGAGGGLWLGYLIGDEIGKSSATTKNGKRKLHARHEDRSGDGKVIGMILGGILGWAISTAINSNLEPDREKEKASNIKKYQDYLKQYQPTLTMLIKRENDLLNQLKTYSPTIKKEFQVLNPAYEIALQQRKIWQQKK